MVDDLVVVGDLVSYMGITRNSLKQIHKGTPVHYEILGIRGIWRNPITQTRVGRNTYDDDNEIKVTNENGYDRWYPASEFKKVTKNVVEDNKSSNEVEKWKENLIKSLIEAYDEYGDTYCDKFSGLEDYAERMGFEVIVETKPIISLVPIKKG